MAFVHPEVSSHRPDVEAVIENVLIALVTDAFGMSGDLEESRPAGLLLGDNVDSPPKLDKFPCVAHVEMSKYLFGAFGLCRGSSCRPCRKKYSEDENQRSKDPSS